MALYRIPAWLQWTRAGQTSAAATLPESVVDQVDAHVWLGNYRARQLVPALAIQHVICIVEAHEPGGAGPYWAALPPGVREHTFNMPDEDEANVCAVAEWALPLMQEAAAYKERVLVHCWAGKSRSAAVVCAYLMTRDACSFDTALAHLRTKRAVVDPNPGFCAQLREWDTHEM
jgi:hypothetical protein